MYVIILITKKQEPGQARFLLALVVQSGRSDPDTEEQDSCSDYGVGKLATDVERRISVPNIEIGKSHSDAGCCKPQLARDNLLHFFLLRTGYDTKLIPFI